MKGTVSTVPLGVRKGAWTHEEDLLLRKCVEKYGEGKWHHVPLRAGLNRCRKSCRLRWLNYLRPNIKRGDFSPDEVDLIMRLHKLLGNRWSLIAGRIPGRTANDIKNYWNTHLQKKKQTEIGCKTTDDQDHQRPNNNNTGTTIVIKPRPRTFSSNLHWLRDQNIASTTNHQADHSGGHLDQSFGDSSFCNVSKPLPPDVPFDEDGDGSSRQWWENLFSENGLVGDDDVALSAFGSAPAEDEQPTTSIWTNGCEISPPLTDDPTGGCNSFAQEVGLINDWSDFPIDVDVCDLLNSEQAAM